jgi:hypothetical protein
VSRSKKLAKAPAGVPAPEIPAPVVVELVKDARVRISFVYGASLTSRLIAWYGQGSGGYSHVDIVLPDGSLLGARDDVIGGAPRAGIYIRPDHYEKWLRRCIVEIPCTKAQADAAEKWGHAQVGKEYDRGAILSFIFGTKQHEPGHWICSALGTGFLRAGKLLHELPIHPSQVTPNALHLLATAGSGGTQTIVA